MIRCIKLAILCALLVSLVLCLYFVISNLEYKEMPNLHQYWQQGHATLFNPQQGNATPDNLQQKHSTPVDLQQRHTTPVASQQRYTTPVDSQQGHTTPVNSQQKHSTLLEKHKVTNHDVPAKTSKFELPQFVIDHVKTFVFFVGFAHSGHSIVGSLLDSHPHVVISHELNVFALLFQEKISPTRHDIFNAIWNNSKQWKKG